MPLRIFTKPCVYVETDHSPVENPEEALEESGKLSGVASGDLFSIVEAAEVTVKQQEEAATAAKITADEEGPKFQEGCRSNSSWRSCCQDKLLL